MVVMGETWIWDSALPVYVLIALFTLVYTVNKWLTAAHRRNHAGKALGGVDILNIIRTSKLFPILHGPLWKLHDFLHDMRVWKGHLVTNESPEDPITLFSCFSKVKGSSQVVLRTLSDLQKYPEWHPQLSGVIQMTRAREAPPIATRTKSTLGFPVQHDYVSLETDFAPSRLARALNYLSVILKGKPFVSKVINIHRYWHREDNGCCWLLEAPECETGGEWTFYLAQPVEGWFEMDQCLLTVVQAINSTPSYYEVATPALRLAALQNYFLYRKVQCTPLTCVTVPNAMAHNHSIPESDPIPTYPIRTSETHSSSLSKSKSVDDLKVMVQHQSSSPESAVSETSFTPRTENNILKRFRNLIEEKKEWYEERKRKNISSSGSEQNAPTPTGLNDLHEEELENSDSDGSYCMDEPPPGYTHIATANPETEPKVRRKTLLQYLRGSNLGISTSDEDPRGGGEENPWHKAVVSRTGLSLNLIRKFKSPDEQNQAEVATEAEIESNGVEPKECTEDNNLGYRFLTIANTVAAELLAEKIKVANIDIGLSYDEQASQTGGWIYCGLEKEVVILRRLTDDVSPLQSYLGKGIIPVAPKLVFEALKNPRTRFTYDEMLKNVDILHDFGNGLKIVYLYHEVSQLFRKEARDFCMLQNERIEGFKYIITMKSVSWPDCPVKEDIVRGKFHSSGWIIEPANRDNKLYSMVTYIVQMELGTSKTSSGYLVEELAAKQPLSIANLRYYLAPSLTPKSNQNSHSSSTEHKVAPPPVGTLAAAAAFATQGTHRGSFHKSASLDV